MTGSKKFESMVRRNLMNINYGTTNKVFEQSVPQPGLSMRVESLLPLSQWQLQIAATFSLQLIIEKI
jgi:hypothetical protein